MLALAIALLASSFAIAQGGEGRTESFVPSTASSSRNKIAKASFQRPAKPKPVLPKPGTILLTANETGISVDLTRSDYPEPPLSITTNGPISRSLDAGQYDLNIKKYGFFDETRRIDLSPGEYRKVNVIMRPKMSALTVKTNISDAEIDVENVGSFTEPLERLLVTPGTYRITIRRRGYVSQTITAGVTVAGKEQSIYVVLEPLRIESVLWTANKAIERGELDLATDHVNDVLALNPSHAKANLVRGTIELRRGSENAITYFLKAIDGGETVLLPMRVMHSGQLIEINVGIDRETISFANQKYLDLNFRILRNELDEFSLATDQNQSSYLAVRGKSDFYGKPVRPEMRLYSRADFCMSVNSCRTELEVLNKFASTWRKSAIR